jgi:putative lipoic acid-binding regulatory protein
MLIDFPEIKKDISRDLLKIFKNSVNSESRILENMQKTMQHEGTSGTYSSVEGTIRNKDYQQMKVEFEILYSELPNLEIVDAIRIVQEKGKEMGEQLGKYTFSTVEQVTNETGNVVDAKGKPFSLGMMFELLEKMEIPFDMNDNPHMPTVVIHPNQMDRIREEIQREEIEKNMNKDIKT